MISFKLASKLDARLVDEIITRYEELLKDFNAHHSFDRMSVSMDLIACHCNGCPLQLKELLAADDLNFSHDVAGITKYIDRQTGRLTDCFLPRFAVPEKELPPLEAGQTVNVYGKPITDEDLEGAARLVKKLRDVNADGLEAWAVNFDTDSNRSEDCVSRQIRKSNRISGL